mgnify:CR=1 FL=1
MMRKQVNRILYLVLVTLIVAMSFGCSKKGDEKKKAKRMANHLPSCEKLQRKGV